MRGSVVWYSRRVNYDILNKKIVMSPTVFRHKKYRFFFFSREESRIHVHVECPEGEAKFWLEPVVALAEYESLAKADLHEIQRIVEGKKDEIVEAWRKHFGY